MSKSIKLKNNIYLDLKSIKRTEKITFSAWLTLFMVRTDSSRLYMCIPLSELLDDSEMSSDSTFSIRLFNNDGSVQGNYDVPISAINYIRRRTGGIMIEIVRADMSSNPGSFAGVGCLTTNLVLNKN